jgi:hypothetical protein
MQRKHLMKTVFFCFALVSAATAAWAQTDNKALIGTWNMVSVTADGDQVKWTLGIKDGGDGKLVGAMKSEEGEVEAKDFSVSDGVVKLKAPYQGDYYDIELKYADGKLAGKWMGGGSEGETTGTKAM